MPRIRYPRWNQPRQRVDPSTADFTRLRILADVASQQPYLPIPTAPTEEEEVYGLPYLSATADTTFPDDRESRPTSTPSTTAIPVACEEEVKDTIVVKPPPATPKKKLLITTSRKKVPSSYVPDRPLLRTNRRLQNRVVKSNPRARATTGKTTANEAESVKDTTSVNPGRRSRAPTATDPPSPPPPPPPPAAAAAAASSEVRCTTCETVGKVRCQVVKRDLYGGATGRNGGHTKAASYMSFLDHVEAVGLEGAKQIARLELANIKAVHAFAREHNIPCALHPCQTIDVIYSPTAWASAKAGVAAMRSAFQRNHPKPTPASEPESSTSGQHPVPTHPSSESEPPLNPPDLDVFPEGQYTLLTRTEVLSQFPVHDILPPWPPSSAPTPTEDETHIQGGVVYFAGSLSAYALTIGVLRECLRRGPGEFNLQTWTAATKLLQRGQHVVEADSGYPWEVHTPRGVVRAHRVVLATNGYTAALLSEFQGRILPVRGQVTAQRPGKALPEGGCLPTTYSFIYGSGYEYMVTQQRDTGARWPGDVVIGGGLMRTSEQGRDECGVTDDGAVNAQISEYLSEAALRYFGGADGSWGEDDPEGRVRREWTGIMGFSPDGFPFVGEVPGQEGLWVSGGFNGNGMVMCWMCARAVVDMMEGKDDETLREWFPEAWRLTKERMERRFEGETLV
ncbi:hypothetical protein VTJ49DRAFT_7548 [Mycothermus thermophilus]|uniref:FAD dependent oxidoreductase domain-containing protein n=1 Tax=Humicola insolens TaxID=85995 RepID=A0ABR3VGS9_HUMIN